MGSPIMRTPFLLPGPMATKHARDLVTILEVVFRDNGVVPAWSLCASWDSLSRSGLMPWSEMMNRLVFSPHASG